MPHRHHHKSPIESKPQDSGISDPSYRPTADSSPSQRYRAFRDRQSYRRSAAARFAAQAPFAFDAFQQEANEALEAGDNVLVAAPTGAGKTVIADFAMFLAQEHNVKAFYTTPIKALSNQKYHDLVDRYGSERVGLLTGDISINPDADIVVMTTEVLRNMIYEHSTTLQSLRYVVLDEVHYLADRFRGPVWEEVIVQLPKSVRIIGLSATVSNVEDFSSWIASVRGATHLVISEHRPVPLEQHVMIQADAHSEPELIDLYRRRSDERGSELINPALASRLDQLDRRCERRNGGSGRAVLHGHDHHQARGGRTGHDRGGRAEGTVQRYMPRRWAVIDELNYLQMLPGIYFIFSRNGCDQAVQQCLNAGLELTTHEEALRIRRIVDDMADGQLSYDDLKALHFSQFRFALEEGFAPHHAGMVALFREIVEHLFELGLVKTVFATETLALGINMPARSVIVEKLEKFNGSEHVMLTPGEFTQLTGRAGRRGIDPLGHAVVVDHRDFAPATLVALSSKRVYPLHSSFSATCNMAVNLLANNDYATARLILAHSFAQWEANESAEQLQSRIATLHEAVAGYERAFHCDRGDFASLMRIRRELSALEKGERQRLRHQAFASQQERRQAEQTLQQHIAVLRAEDREHPCLGCPHIADHLKWGHRWNREQGELERLESQYRHRTGSVARQFDSICDILVEFGYLRRQQSHRESYDGDITLTGNGEMLRRLYGEQDLVLAQAIINHVFDDLTARQLAATLSSLVFHARKGGGDEPRHYPDGSAGPVAQACSRLRSLNASISERFGAGELEPLEPLDFGLVSDMYDWAGGTDLRGLLREGDLTGGDFVRCTKRLADLLQQISIAAPYCVETPDTLVRRATAARQLVFRGVVAYSGID